MVRKLSLLITSTTILTTLLLACGNQSYRSVREGFDSIVLIRITGNDGGVEIYPSKNNHGLMVANLKTRGKSEGSQSALWFEKDLPDGWKYLILPRGTNYLRIEYSNASYSPWSGFEESPDVWRIDIPLTSNLIYSGSIKFNKCSKAREFYLYECKDPIIENEETIALDFAKQFFSDFGEIETQIMRSFYRKTLLFK